MSDWRDIAGSFAIWKEPPRCLCGDEPADQCECDPLYQQALALGDFRIGRNGSRVPFISPARDGGTR